ncbi:Endoribonuclease PemK [Escherichia coli]|nr:Endoribonuclease PemK [Escherichia coli]
MERGKSGLSRLILPQVMSSRERGRCWIVTPAAFNRVTRLPVVVPVTSGGNFARTAGFAVSLDGVGIRTTGVVRCDQPRTIDMKARGGKRLERVPETIMNEVLGRLSTILT